MILTIIVFILILGLLIFVHELGHFVMAKRAGVKVEEFGFGYPPRLFGIKKGETIYSLNLLPLGGFVRIFGEDGLSEDKQNDKRAFFNQPIGRRALILVAGVTMNLILAAFLLGVGHFIGLPTVVDDSQSAHLKNTKVQITQVGSGSPANEAGIQIGDTIKQISVGADTVSVNTVGDVQQFSQAHQGQEVAIVLGRGQETIEKNVFLREAHPADEGPLGIGLARTAIVSYPWYQAIVKGIVSAVNLTWFIAVTFVSILWQLATTGHLIVDISGPVGIFNLTGQATQLGFIYVLQFTAIFSINLAILNIFPFPALDGGRLLFLAIEKIKGSPVSQNVERMVHTAGFIILMLLMVAVTWRDIVRFF